jgi:hypothetical protein
MKFVAMVTRTLKPGKTYDDYRKAWFHTTGFGMPTTMYTVINAFNPKEIISIGLVDGEFMDLVKGLEIDVKERLENPLDHVIESTIVRTFGVVAAVDDFSPAGKLNFVPPMVDGKLTDYNQIASALDTIATEIKNASAKRENLKNS